ncbi:hypothetical protein [Faecalibacter bovis]|uniref:Lipoprotein n=1 Tax=Faecalibacter bovis TaxID=2898187 RepID=A0ABX7XFA4_9FLAO|nr:hypothetical protein [Faecalibacter bovis]QTV06548.1 hypothetical protein J9309_04280 [Faecalibacter bovis]
MKKFFALVAVATLSLGAVSCGEKAETVETEAVVDSAAAVVDSAAVVVDSAAAVVDSAAAVVDSAAVAVEEAPAQ